jgi:hypothetical protein
MAAPESDADPITSASNKVHAAEEEALQRWRATLEPALEQVGYLTTTPCVYVTLLGSLKCSRRAEVCSSWR